MTIAEGSANGKGQFLVLHIFQAMIVFPAEVGWIACVFFGHFRVGMVLLAEYNAEK